MNELLACFVSGGFRLISGCTCGSHRRTRYFMSTIIVLLTVHVSQILATDVCGSKVS